MFLKHKQITHVPFQAEIGLQRFLAPFLLLMPDAYKSVGDEFGTVPQRFTRIRPAITAACRSGFVLGSDGAGAAGI